MYNQRVLRENEENSCVTISSLSENKVRMNDDVIRKDTEKERRSVTS